MWDARLGGAEASLRETRVFVNETTTASGQTDEQTGQLSFLRFFVLIGPITSDDALPAR